MAFTQMKAQEGEGGPLTKGMAVMQKAMMGTAPTKEETDALLAELKS